MAHFISYLSSVQPLILFLTHIGCLKWTSENLILLICPARCVWSHGIVYLSFKWKDLKTSNGFGFYDERAPSLSPYPLHNAFQLEHYVEIYSYAHSQLYQCFTICVILLLDIMCNIIFPHFLFNLENMRKMQECLSQSVIFHWWISGNMCYSFPHIYVL